MVGQTHLPKPQEHSAIWVHKDENVRFLSRFTGDSTELLITPRRCLLITDSRYTEQAMVEAEGWEVINHQGQLYGTISKVLQEENISLLSVEASSLSVMAYWKLQEQFPELVINDINLDSLRQVKKDTELYYLKRAAQIAANALYDILPQIAAQRTENEVRIALEQAMLAHGSEHTAFATIVASGKRSALPHGTATDKRIEIGDFVTIDFGAVYRGYHSDMTRTFVIGSASDRQRQLYDAVAHVQRESVKKVRSGVAAHTIDAFARQEFGKAGLNQYFIHSLGHGVGLEIHELPTLSPKCETILEPNMVVTVEPGIYISGYGGIRIEDTVVVKEGEPEIITLFPHELMEL